jgi:hypothetical protein
MRLGIVVALDVKVTCNSLGFDSYDNKNYSILTRDALTVM